METLRFTINGKLIEEREVSPTTTLLQYLRNQLHLTGTKEGCAEGDCGACTVAIIDPHTQAGPRFRAINSCLVLLPMLQGKEVYTVEGLQDGTTYHPAQESLVQALGSQCGYCTPGVVMSMFESCYRTDLDADWKLDDQMCGNLCRCTGYRPIMEATREIAGSQPEDRFAQALRDASVQSMEVTYATNGQSYWTPNTFEGLWDTLDAHPAARLVCGGTDLSLEVTKQFKELPELISLEGIPELKKIAHEETGLHIGAAVVLSEIEAVAADAFPAIERMLRFFGARQIKNRGTIGGNICTASPIGDMAPVLLSLGALIRLRSRQGVRELPLDAFFLDYRKTVLQTGEIMDSIFVPYLSSTSDIRSCAYKVSKRQELDISSVSAGLYVQLSESGIVEQARFAFGGVAATPARARKTEQAIEGKLWNEENVESILSFLEQDFTPLSDHRGSAWYRAKVTANLLRGFYLETRENHQPSLPYRPTGTVALESAR